MFCALGLVLFGQGLWIHAEALLAQVLLERAFAATLARGRPVKPWSWADTWPVARIEVPRLHRTATVLAGASGQALTFGPGHVERTPNAGEPGTAVFAAHRDTSFAFLGDLRVGDEIRVTCHDGHMFRFRVTGMSVVCWDASGIDPHAGGHNLYLPPAGRSTANSRTRCATSSMPRWPIAPKLCHGVCRYDRLGLGVRVHEIWNSCSPTRLCEKRASVSRIPA